MPLQEGAAGRLGVFADIFSEQTPLEWPWSASQRMTLSFCSKREISLVLLVLKHVQNAVEKPTMVSFRPYGTRVGQ